MHKIYIKYNFYYFYMNSLITVAVFYNPQEILVLKSVLEHKGINYFFENETLVSIDPFASIAYGGIKLKVHTKDVEQVKEILNNLNNNLKIV